MENYRYLNYYNVMVVTQRKRYFEQLMNDGYSGNTNHILKINYLVMSE